MKVEELEKLKKGAQLIDDINSRKFLIEDTEKAMEACYTRRAKTRYGCHYPRK